MSFVQNWFGKECNIEVVKSIKENYLEPENTDLLSGKDLNEEIMKTPAMTKTMKSQDLGLKIVQHNLGASASACVNTLGVIRNEKTIPKNVKKALATHITNALIMQAKCMQDITFVRKNIVKPALNIKYADHMVLMQHHDDKKLFGSDLAKDIKEIEENSKASKEIGRVTTGFTPNTHPYLRGRGNFTARYRGQYRGNFLGRNVRPYQRFQRGGYQNQAQYQGYQPHNMGYQKHQTKGQTPKKHQ